VSRCSAKPEPLSNELLLSMLVYCFFKNRLGGGEGVLGIYGSVTASGMQRILECLHYNCSLDKGSTLLDVGAGLARCVQTATCKPVAYKFANLLLLTSSITGQVNHSPCI
jgi:hypothetical protein